MAQAVALGQIGLSLDDFYSLTPEEFALVSEKWSELRTINERSRWEMAREISYWSAAPHLKNKSKAKFMPFPWEKKSGKKEKREPGREEKLKKIYGERAI